MVVLIDEDIQTANQALQRVREQFSTISFTGPREQKFQVTFSAGIAEFPRDGHDAETLLSTADARLLRAKESGRNRIVIGHR